MRRYATPFILAMSLLLANAARADDFCTTLSAVADEAPDKFRSLRGNSDGTGDYESNTQLPGAYHCLVYTDGTFVCKWRAGIAAGAAEAAQKLGDGIAGCYPSAKFRESTVYPKSARYSYVVHGVRFYVGVDEVRNTVRLSIAAESD